eukprot:TRINITY_DN5969_c0_g1_i2.p1 TRINITY_DN5969_c0_g1~~TRINITY_DN5969_c0_g1_i2.p1  ORF type:complete len:287 (-),score=27.49 TRINITY_DN5969_c0_g1_i2:42-902(-)
MVDNDTASITPCLTEAHQHQSRAGCRTDCSAWQVPTRYYLTLPSCATMQQHLALIPPTIVSLDLAHAREWTNSGEFEGNPVLPFPEVQLTRCFTEESPRYSQYGFLLRLHAHADIEITSLEFQSASAHFAKTPSQALYSIYRYLAPAPCSVIPTDALQPICENELFNVTVPNETTPVLLMKPQHSLSIPVAKGTIVSLLLHSAENNCAVAVRPPTIRLKQLADLHLSLLPGNYTFGRSPWSDHSTDLHFLFDGNITYKVAGNAPSQPPMKRDDASVDREALLFGAF